MSALGPTPSLARSAGGPRSTHISSWSVSRARSRKLAEASPDRESGPRSCGAAPHIQLPHAENGEWWTFVICISIFVHLREELLDLRIYQTEIVCDSTRGRHKVWGAATPAPRSSKSCIG